MGDNKIEEIIKKIMGCAQKDACEKGDCEYFYCLHELEILAEYLEHHKALNIVHCKECKWYNKGENESDSWATCRLITGRHDVHDDFYCANGERANER